MMKKYEFKVRATDFASGGNDMDNQLTRSMKVEKLLNENFGLVDGELKNVIFSDNTFGNRKLYVIGVIEKNVNSATDKMKEIAKNENKPETKMEEKANPFTKA